MPAKQPTFLTYITGLVIHIAVGAFGFRFIGPPPNTAEWIGFGIVCVPIAIVLNYFAPCPFFMKVKTDAT